MTMSYHPLGRLSQLLCELTWSLTRPASTMQISQFVVLFPIMFASSALANLTPAQGGGTGGKGTTTTGQGPATPHYTITCRGRIPDPKVMMSQLCVEPSSECEGNQYHPAAGAANACSKCSCALAR